MSVQALVIGFSGKRGSGKDTAAAAMTPKADVKGFYIIRRAFGDALKEEAAEFLATHDYHAVAEFLNKWCPDDHDMFNNILEQTFDAEPVGWRQKLGRLFGVEYVHDFTKFDKETILSWFHDRDRKEQFRYLLQWWGTDYRRAQFSDTYWLDRLGEYISGQIAYSETEGLGSVGLAQPLLFLVPDVRFPNEVGYVQNELQGYCIRVDRPSAEIGDQHPSETALDNCTEFNLRILNDQTLEDLEQASKVAFLGALSWKWGDAGRTA